MKKMIFATLALLTASVTSYAAFPWLVSQAKDRHPVGYVRYVESKLDSDLQTMKKARLELGAEVTKLSQQDTDLAARAQRAEILANDFRIAYQKINNDGSEATVVHGCAYTRPQIQSQVSLLLAEAEGYQDSLAAIESTLTEGNRRMEQFAVQIGKTESQIAMLATKRELIRIQELTTEGEQLLADVDQLLIENSQTVACSPVRTSWEIQDESQEDAIDQKVADYLAAAPDVVAVETTTVVSTYLDTSQGEQTECDFGDTDAPAVPQSETRNTKVQKPRTKPQASVATHVEEAPIFQQSIRQK
jgi:hypothetical protein